MKKKYKYIIIVLILLIVLAVGIYIKVSGLWEMIVYNTKYEFEFINNPSQTKSITILTHTRSPWFDSHIYTYIIPDKYHKHEVPKDENYIMSDTSLDFKWKNDDTIIIYTSREPLVDKFNFDGVKTEWVIGGVLYRQFEDQKNISH